MKNHHILLLILFLFFAVIRCTEDSQTINGPEDEEIPPPPDYSDSFDFYPLDIGNYWVYGNLIEDFYSIEVIGDTVMPNQNEYQILQKIQLKEIEDTTFKYERLDSLTSVVYGYNSDEDVEYMLDSLAVNEKDRYYGNRFMEDFYNSPYLVYCYSIDTVEVFGSELEQKYLGLIGGDLPVYHLVKGIGVTDGSWGRGGGINLRYAKIRGKEYYR